MFLLLFMSGAFASGEWLGVLVGLVLIGPILLISLRAWSLLNAFYLAFVTHLLLPTSIDPAARVGLTTCVAALFGAAVGLLTRSKRMGWVSFVVGLVAVIVRLAVTRDPH